MTFEEMIKYLLWVVFFILVIAGLSFLLKQMGIL